MESLIVIPARLASVRLSRKPLLKIAGEPMIVHVWRRACEAASGPVIVAAGDEEIVRTIKTAGGEAVLTDLDLPSGTDRVCAAVKEIDPHGFYNQVINLQGDLPDVDPTMIRSLSEFLSEGRAEIVTLVAPVTNTRERGDPNIVKAVVSLDVETRVGRALDFTRAATTAGDGPLYQHIGIYGFARSALERFVALPPSPREKHERLEQLRAIQAGMHIDVLLVDSVPTGVDTPADLERVRQKLTADSI